MTTEGDRALDSQRDERDSNRAIGSTTIDASVKSLRNLLSRKKGKEPDILTKKAKDLCKKVIESPAFTITLSILAFWSLFSLDIMLAATEKNTDVAFDAILSIIFFVFLLEFGASCFYREDYLWFPDWTSQPGESFVSLWFRRIQFGSFYFWLDLIATLSLIIEIQWMFGTLVENTTSQSEYKGANTARALVRATRIVRIVRMLRVLRILKIYRFAPKMPHIPFIHRPKKSLMERRREESMGLILRRDPTGSTGVTRGGSNGYDYGAPPTSDKESSHAESHVGAAMTDLTNRRVILLVLLMIIVIPLLTVTEYDLSERLAVQLVQRMALYYNSDPTTYVSGYNVAIANVIANTPVISIKINGAYILQNTAVIDRLRDVEKAYCDSSDGSFSTWMVFNEQSRSQEQALYSIYTTIFVTFLLVTGTYFFSADVNKLVIGPIEKMVELVRKISANPLGVQYKMLGEKEGFLEGLETTVLLTTINKIGGLMRVGFGEAGASVIAKNLADSSGGRLNLMNSGTMINSIFGFCDVRQFTDTTECLQEEVMLFVNRIAHILHGIVVQCSGSANKNIGDAFLLTWKIDDALTPAQRSSMADKALLAFCKSLIELSRHQEFICNFSVGATARLFKRFPNYKVRIGAGLHYGWAIEGAIGSNRKIDASYLSPNVNFTEYLESSTKAYGVPLLLSEPFFNMLSPAAAKCCRQVDRIKRSEGDDPIGLYTYDCDMNIDWNDESRHDTKKVRLPIRAAMGGGRRKSFDRGGGALSGVGGLARQLSQAKVPSLGLGLGLGSSGTGLMLQKGMSFRAGGGGGGGGRFAGGEMSMRVKPGGGAMKDPSNAMTMRRIGAVAELPDPEAGGDPNNQDRSKKAPTIVILPYRPEMWEFDPDLVELRHLVNNKNFQPLWESGIAAYVKGDWQKARDIFHETVKLGGGADGPSKFLIETIDAHGGTAPHGWQGYRLDGDGH